MCLQRWRPSSVIIIITSIIIIIIITIVVVCPPLLWHCRLGYAACKIVPEITYTFIMCPVGRIHSVIVVVVPKRPTSGFRPRAISAHHRHARHTGRRPLSGEELQESETPATVMSPPRSINGNSEIYDFWYKLGIASALSRRSDDRRTEELAFPKTRNLRGVDNSSFFAEIRGLS